MSEEVALAVRGKTVHLRLTASEREILDTLMGAEGAVSTQTLHDTIRVYGRAPTLSANSHPLPVLVRRLRKKLETAGISDAIRTFHGYALATEDRGEGAA